MNGKDSKKHINIPAARLIPLIEEQLSLGKSVRFAPKGVSMLPLLREGRDTVTLSPITTPVRKYDILLYRRKNGQYVLHRLVKTKREPVFAGDNQYVFEKGITEEMFIGVVTEIFREDKRVCTNELLYKAYCVIWCKTRLFRRVIRGVLRRMGKILKKGSNGNG